MTVEKFNFYQNPPYMTMSRFEYNNHFNLQKEKRVSIMCRPISEIRGKSANYLLELSGQQQSIPVDVKALLRKLKISCMPYDFSTIEAALNADEDISRDIHILGALATNGDRAAIYCRKEDEEGGHRYRFTIAHELGHCCLAHFPIDGATVHYVFRMDDESTDPKEIAANIFAGELLIPQDSLENVIKELLLPDVQTLADIFAVSRNVMLARLKYLNISKNIVGYNY